MSQHTEDQKKQIYDGLSSEEKSKQTYAEWVKEAYNDKYEKWMPWIEDKYLALFGKDNKASYATKDTLDKSKVTGIDQVDKVQDGVNNLVSGQVGKGGLLQPAGDWVSKEGVNRAERGGKDEKGTYGGAAAEYTDPLMNNAKNTGQGLTGGAQSAGNTLTDGAKSASGYLSGMFGGGKKE